LFTWIKIF